MKSRVRFYVIFTVDIPINSDWTQDVYLCHCLPGTIKEDMKRKPKYRKTWTLTECHKGDEFGTYQDYLHRKYVGEMDADTFRAFCDDLCFTSSCKTMGMITGFGHMPAISLDCGDSEYFGNAYVSPLLDGNAIEQELEGLPKAQIDAICELELWPIFDRLMKALEDVPDDDGETWDTLQGEYVADLKQMILTA